MKTKVNPLYAEIDRLRRNKMKACKILESSYRIMFVNGLGYYPQKKSARGWKKIGEHPTGYGLYPESNLSYPKETKIEAMKIIDKFIEWEVIKDRKPEYIPYIPITTKEK